MASGERKAFGLKHLYDLLRPDIRGGGPPAYSAIRARAVPKTKGWPYLLAST